MNERNEAAELLVQRTDLNIIIHKAAECQHAWLHLEQVGSPLLGWHLSVPSLQHLIRTARLESWTVALANSAALESAVNVVVRKLNARGSIRGARSCHPLE